MKKSEFRGLATLKAGGRARAKGPKGPWPSDDPKVAGPATEFSSSIPLRYLKNVQLENR